MKTYNLRIRTIGPDGTTSTGWYIADGHFVAEALTDALMHYEGLRATYMGLECAEVVRQAVAL